MVKISDVIGEVVSYTPVIRVVVDIVSTCFSVLRSAISQVEAETKQLEEIHRWLKDNDVNTFSDFYSEYIETGKYKMKGK